jgi:hypothetical protein
LIIQAGITKIRYNNASQLDHNAGRFEIGAQQSHGYSTIQLNLSVIKIAEFYQKSWSPQNNGYHKTVKN